MTTPIAGAVSVLETVTTAFGHAVLGIFVGQVLDNIVDPAVEDESGELVGKTDMGEAVEVFIQFGVGMVIMHEAFNWLLPSSPLYTSPIGDGLATFFFLYSQPKLLRKIERLVHRTRSRLLGLDNLRLRDAHGLPTREDVKGRLASTPDK